MRVDEVPDEDERVVGAGGEHAAPRGGPLDAVGGGGVAAEFEERLAGLPHVEDADQRAVGGEGGQEVRVMGGGWEEGALVWGGSGDGGVTYRLDGARGVRRTLSAGLLWETCGLGSLVRG